MKKFTKGCIIAACIFIFLGMIIVVSAFAVGGPTKVIDLFRSGEFDFTYYNKNIDFFEDDYDDKYNGYQEVAITNFPSMEDVNELTIDVDGSLLYIRSTTDTNYSIEVKDTRYLKSYMDGSEFIIVDKKGYKNDNWDERELYLNVPEGTKLSEINIDIGAGKIIADTLFAEEVSIEVGAGKVEIKEVTARESSFSVGVGEIVLKNATLENVELSVVTGKIELQGAVTGNLEADCSIGGIHMLLDGKKEDHNYEVASSMGSIRIGDSSMDVLSQKQIVSNGANSEFEISCSLGDVEVDFKE